VTRMIRPLALVVMLVFAAAGCVQQGKPAAPKKIKRVAAAKKGRPGPAATKPTSPSERDAKRPTGPDATKPTMPTPTRPGADSGLKPPPPPPRPERRVAKDIEPEELRLPIYPGAEVRAARETTWLKGRLGALQTATLHSNDAPDKILEWYKAKFGAEAEVGRPDRKDSRRKAAWVRLMDPKTKLLKSSAWVSWTEEKPGEITDVRVQLVVFIREETPAK